jgi:hypothetical protein
MANSPDRQGTGKHGHKDTEEPYPHRQAGGGQQHSAEHSGSRQHGSESSSGSQQQKGEHSGSGQQGSSSEDLKSREYRDQQGNVHHHTKTYEEQHKNERK